MPVLREVGADRAAGWASAWVRKLSVEHRCSSERVCLQKLAAIRRTGDQRCHDREP